MSTTARLPVLSQYPVDWGEQLVTWSPNGDTLYYVDRPEAFAIRRFRPGAEGPGEPLFFFDGDYIRDLYVSPDGARLGFLTWTRGECALHAIDLGTGEDEVLTRFTGPFSRVFGRGWLRDGRRFVLVRTSAVHEDSSADIDVLVASGGSAPALVATTEGGFTVTSRLDSARGVLYLTRMVGGIHNVYAVGLDERRTVAVTDNRLPGVTFSGIRPVRGGGFVVVQNERKRDIWISEIADGTGR